MKTLTERYLNFETLFNLIEKILPILLVFILCLIVVKIIMKFVKKIISKSKLEKSLHTFIENTIKIVLYFIVVLIIADMLSIPITSLVATFSVVGLAASLAIQDALGNIASGIMILATHPFKNGDYIEGGGTAGTVKDINFSHTQLITPDNKVIRIPNKEIINATIINYSEQPIRMLQLVFGISYDANPDKVKEIMRNIATKHEKVLKDKDIFTRTTALKNNCVEYTLKVWAKGSDYWSVHFDLLETIREEFNKNNIEIAHDKLDVHIINK